MFKINDNLYQKFFADENQIKWKDIQFNNAIFDFHKDINLWMKNQKFIN